MYIKHTESFWSALALSKMCLALHKGDQGKGGQLENTTLKL